MMPRSAKTTAAAKKRKSGKPTIGELIKDVRKRKNIRAETVAECCNVTRERVFQWDHQDYIMEKNFEGLSKALGITVRHLKMANAKAQSRAKLGAHSSDDFSTSRK
jgi:transcriptional regulator with XRE-family HTH domain